MEYTLTITNTSDGTVSTTIVGRTDSSGTDSKTWTAPTASLYAIDHRDRRLDKIYGILSGGRAECRGTARLNTAETVYTLESTVGKNKITSVYGTPIPLTVQQQTVTARNGNKCYRRQQNRG